MGKSTRRPVELTARQRDTLRRLVRDEARRLGWGVKYHHDTNFPLGPQDWPDALRRLETLMHALQERPRFEGGLAWPGDSQQSATSTARTART